MAITPTRSACFQPNNYWDLDLFADREQRLEDLFQTFVSFLDPDGPGEARILVRGHRGVGKSMLVRKAIDKVIHSLQVIRVEVDCGHVDREPEAVLRQLAAELAREAIDNATDDFLRREAEVLLRLSETTHVKVRDVQRWSSELKLGGALRYKLSDTVQFEFGMSRVAGRSREVEETSDRPVNMALLQRLITDFVSDGCGANERFLVLIDNLDQVGDPERQEDVRRVMDLARFLFGMRKCVVVATMRSEFVSADLRKLYSYEETVPGFSPDELCLIANRRMEHAGERQRRALNEARFSELARVLAQWTDNAWGFLSWLADLDYARFDPDPAQPAKLREALLPLALQRHSGVRPDEMHMLAKVYQDQPTGFRTAAELASVGVSDELRERAVKYNVLVPDWLLSPDRYMLHPGLYVFAVADTGSTP